ncbi:PaaI family thioesterase [Pseudonocardia halophobica]|uniref:PaaI family thioesterase n=1 Tax=Pseudonocardia halophobica TaxID=29401 RepID=UPI003D90308C
MATSRMPLLRTLAVELDHVRPGELTLSMPADPAWTQQHGYLHAGAVATLADSACGYAAIACCRLTGTC